MLNSYNLDRPGESWSTLEDSYPLKHVQEVAVSRGWLAVLDADVDDQAAQPAPNAAAPNGPAPAGPDVVPAYHLYLFRLAATSPTNPAESGVNDYAPLIADSAGITSQWQAVDGGFYYLAGDKTLHLLRGSAR
jgi:hypothetical protein